MTVNANTKKIVVFLAAGLALLVVPLVAQQFGNAWVRIIDIALLYVLLALGLNIVVGYAGLLDLGYVAFYAVGAYLFVPAFSARSIASTSGLAVDNGTAAPQEAEIT